MATINNVRSYHRPQRSYMYEVHIRPRTTGLLTIRDLSVYAKTVSIPAKTIDFIPSSFIGVKTHYPVKDSSPQTLNITFWDDEGLTVYEYFDDWLKRTHDLSEGTSTDKRDLIADIEIRLKNVEDDNETGVIHIKRAFLTELGDINLAYDSSDILEVNATFVYDDKELKK